MEPVARRFFGDGSHVESETITNASARPLSIGIRAFIGDFFRIQIVETVHMAAG